MIVKGKVSVIIPTYDRPTTLSNAIESVLSQTYDNIEIIVVDDNNPNTVARIETENLMNLFSKYNNIHYIQHECNKNGSAARNTGIKNSNGEFIAFLDDDDIFLNNKIELQVNKLNRLGLNWGICYTKFSRMKNGKLIDTSTEKIEGNIWKDVLLGQVYISAGSNILIRRDVVFKINGFNEEFKRRQDLEFLIRASKISKVAYIDEICLIVNKDDPKNVLTTQKDQEDNKQLYLKLFKNEIRELTDEEKLKLNQSFALSSMRNDLITFNVKEIIKKCKINKINYKLFFKYFKYLLYRKIFKKIYGFKF